MILLGSFSSPIPFSVNNPVTASTIYSLDGIEKYMCLKDGIPATIEDTNYFIKISSADELAIIKEKFDSIKALAESNAILKKLIEKYL